MSRIIALLVGVAAVLVVAASPVAAAPGAPDFSPASAGKSVPPDAVGLTLSQVLGSGLAVTLDGGASEEHDLVVSNHTADLRLTIKLTATDATGNLGRAAASWLAFGDDQIQLEPHVAATVPMTIAVPHDTQPGSALAHVTASVESAVAAADGSPVAGTAHAGFPVSISVRGTPTAQIAIADVHRVDQGSQHQLAVVIRNFGDQGAQVSGHVRVAGDQPQTLPFRTNLAASRDTTVNLDWHAPPDGTASDIAVDLEYNGGNVASWSSRLGGAPTDLSTPTADTTATTSPVISDASTTTASPAPAKPWWKEPIVTVLAILALLGAGLWFVFEMRSSKRRGQWVPQPERFAPPPGWAGPHDESTDLAKQLVRLTEVVVQLVSVHRNELDVADERARARSPDDARGARAGPAPPDPVPPVELFEQPEVVRSESLTPSAVARPEPIVVPEPIAEARDDEPEELAAVIVDAPEPEPEPEPDPRAEMMERLVALDRERRRLREWMDAEDSGTTIEASETGEVDA